MPGTNGPIAITPTRNCYDPRIAGEAKRNGVYWIEKLLGVTSVNSDQFTGSAAQYLPNHPDVDQLYAYKVARSCGTEPYCVEVPYDFPGLPSNAWASITYRAYLEPTSHTGPALHQILHDRAIKFTP